MGFGSYNLNLFICFTNDLPSVVNSQIWLYADDKLLFRQIHSIEAQIVQPSMTKDSVTLQRDLDAIMKWNEDWKMFFNLSKCVATP